MKKLLFIWVSFLFLIGCRSILDLEIPDSPSLVVVEAFLTNEDTIQTVRLTSTVGFEDNDISPPITNALVSILSSDGAAYAFGYQNNGYYTSQAIPFTTDASYRLQVVLPNQDTLVTSEENLQPSPRIDSIHYVSVLVPDELNPRIDVERFYPTVYGEDDVKTKDYYLWKIYKNDTLFDQPEDLVLIEDRFFNGNSFRNDFTNFLFLEGDEITLQLEMISKSAFDYLRQFRDQTIIQNNQLQAYPARLQGNIYNQTSPTRPVLGIFSISNSIFFKKKINKP